MGLLRLYLAICVICAHSTSILPWEMHTGRHAVQIFFIISGFYMQLILAGGRYQSVRSFYLSRAIRIFVPYGTILAGVMIVSTASGLFFQRWLTLSDSVENIGQHGAGSGFAVATNFTLVFQDAVMFFGEQTTGELTFEPDVWKAARPLWHYLWVPQAWSISVELVFYLIAPLLISRLSSTYLFVIIGFSHVARAVCYSNTYGPGWNHDPWTYRFFPFELAHFCYGILACRFMQTFPEQFHQTSMLADNIKSKTGMFFYPLTVAALLGLLHAQLRIEHFCEPYAQHFFSIGSEGVYLASLTPWMIIIPLLFSLTKHHSVDRSIGELSYPVYLLHYTMIAILVEVGTAWNLTGPKAMLGIFATALSIATAAILQVVAFHRFETWRQALVTTLTSDPVADETRQSGQTTAKSEK